MLVAHVAAGVAEAFPGVASALPQGGRARAAASRRSPTSWSRRSPTTSSSRSTTCTRSAARPVLERARPARVGPAPRTSTWPMTSRRELAIPTSAGRRGRRDDGRRGHAGLQLPGGHRAAGGRARRAGRGRDRRAAPAHRGLGGGPAAGDPLQPGIGPAASRSRRSAPTSTTSPTEVLAGLPADLQRFLLDTSVLERFTPALAAAVSERPDAAGRHPRPGRRRTCSSSRPRATGSATTTSSRRSCAGAWPSASPTAWRCCTRARRAPGRRPATTRRRCATSSRPAPRTRPRGRSRRWPSRWCRRPSARRWPAGCSASRPRSGGRARASQLAHALLTYLAGDPAAAFEGWDEAIGRLVAAGEAERAAAALYRAQLAAPHGGGEPGDARGRRRAAPGRRRRAPGRRPGWCA